MTGKSTIRRQLERSGVTVDIGIDGRITYVSVELLTNVDLLCRLLAQLPDIEQFRGSACDLSNQGLSELTAWHDLSWISIQNTNITGEGLSSLEAFDKLRYLACWVRLQPEEGTRHIACCTSLTDLVLSGSNLSESHIAKLSALEQLRYFVVSGLQVGEGLSVVQSMPELEELHASETFLDDSVCAALVNCRKLQILGGSYTRISDKGFQELLKVVSLRQVSVGHTMVTKEGIARVADHPNIDTLFAEGIEMSGKSIEGFCRMKKLRSLGVSKSLISKGNIKKLRNAIPNCEIHLSND